MRVLGSVIAIICALTLVSGCTFDDTAEPAPEASAAASGPGLNGRYKVDIGNFITDNGRELPQGAGTFDLLIRSSCHDDVCVATAAAPDAHEPNALQVERVAGDLILDYADGVWQAVETWTGTCTPVGGGEQLDTRNWDSLVLTPKPDGTLTGEYTGRGSLETCAGSTRQHITMTRIGDVGNVGLPDPAAQTPRERSPASGLRGTYDYTSLNVTADVPPGTPGGPKIVYNATTVCLRTGDRCLTYLLTAEGYSRALTFADGKWTETSAPFPGTCLPTGNATKVRRGEFALPPNPADPIPVVHGTVTEEALDGPCKGTSRFENTLTRTGD